MKIALALSGLTRIYTISAASWGRIIGQYNPDVYVHNWCEPDLKDYICDQINWVFKPTAVELEPPPSIDISLYPNRHWPQINVDRSLSMWHSIAAAHSMINRSGNDYDIVMRGRMDLHIHKLNLIDFDGVVMPYDWDKVKLKFQYRGIEMHGFNDHFAYGPPHHMDKYVRTLEEIPYLYSQEGVDYCPENFLTASLAKQGVPVMLQHMEHCLIRG